MQTKTNSINTPVTSSGFLLENVVSEVEESPTRMVLYGLEGWGKTSFCTYAPSPIFLMTRGETGLKTLIQNQRVNKTPHFKDDVKTWNECLQAISALTTQDHDYKTFVVDTINGCERLCFEHVCAKKFDSDWERFASFGRGVEITLAEWSNFLDRLDNLRVRRKMSIILIGHARISTFKNPAGEDFDRYTIDLNSKTWGLLNKWADLVLFGQFETFVKTDKDRKQRPKGTGGQNRIINTERHAAYDAKNRLGLPEEIECGDSAEKAWLAFQSALSKKSS